ncbi:hypothetical protein QTP86_022988 [Hemibagrus guttatus]|nr:hypothetical protein QTP86_022988 [Hemibagrus guttatus]
METRPDKKRAAYFSTAEIDVLMQGCGDYDHTLKKKKKQYSCSGKRERESLGENSCTSQCPTERRQRLGKLGGTCASTTDHCRGDDPVLDRWKGNC